MSKFYTKIELKTRSQRGTAGLKTGSGQSSTAIAVAQVFGKVMLNLGELANHEAVMGIPA